MHRSFVCACAYMHICVCVCSPQRPLVGAEALLGVVYAADRFNFCQLRGRQQHTWNLHDEAFLATGEVEAFGDPVAHVTV